MTGELFVGLVWIFAVIYVCLGASRGSRAARFDGRGRS